MLYAKLRFCPEILQCPAWLVGLLELAYKELCKQLAFNLYSGGMIQITRGVQNGCFQGLACKHEGEEPINLIGHPCRSGGSWGAGRGCGCLCVSCAEGGAQEVLQGPLGSASAPTLSLGGNSFHA